MSGGARAWIGRVAAGVVLALVAVVWLRGLGTPLGNSDEAIYAQNLREMQRSGDYTRLTWQGVEVLQRPSAPFALYAPVAGAVAGERGLRLGPALCSFLALLALYAAAIRGFGRRDAALVAVLLTAGAPSFYLYGRALLSDPPFVAAVVVALWGALWAVEDGRGLVLAAAGLGAAFAMKSLAAGIPAVALFPWLVWAARRHASRRQLLLAAGVFVALAAPFYVLGVIHDGRRFVVEHVGYSLLARARGQLKVGMPGGTAAYARWMWRADGPAVVLLLAGAVLGGLAVAWRKRDAQLGLSAGAALVMWLLLSLVGTRLPHYLLPVYPAAALAAAGLGMHGARAWHARTQASPARARLAGGLVVAAALALALAGWARPTADTYLLPSAAAEALGGAARDAAAPGETVYALDWYAPAFGYYADRRLVMVTSSRSFFRIVDDVDFIHAAGAVTMAPVAAPAGTRLLVAGPRAAIEQAGWLTVEERLARQGDHELVRARRRPGP